MGGRTLGIALGRRSISNKILVDYFVTRERPLYYFSLKLCSLLCIQIFRNQNFLKTPWRETAI